VACWNARVITAPLERFTTTQENELLQKFLAQLAQAHVSARDPEAQAMISRAVAQQPDANVTVNDYSGSGSPGVESLARIGEEVT